MKSIAFEGQNIVIAENQKEYESLPALAQTNGIITFCMQLDAAEVDKILTEKKVNITVLNFGGPVQPISVSTIQPKFPIYPRIKTMSNAKSWDLQEGTATFAWGLTAPQLQVLEEFKVLWITTITYGKPLQPISQILV
jgi:hypothetical protein